MKRKVIAFILAQLIAINCAAAPVYAEKERIDAAVAAGGSAYVDAGNEADVEADPGVCDEADAGADSGVYDGADAGADSGVYDGADAGDHSGEAGAADTDSGVYYETDVDPGVYDEADTDSDVVGAAGEEADIDSRMKDLLLARQEEHLTELPAAGDVRECGDADTFAEAIIALNREYPCSFEGELKLDLNETVVLDEDGEELVGSDQYVTEALLSDDSNEAVEILRNNGYEDVFVEDGMVCANDRYDTGRIFVTSEEDVDTRGALSVIQFGQTYLIQYATSGEAAIAAEMLKDDPGVRDVSPDYVMRQSASMAEETDINVSDASITDASEGAEEDIPNEDSPEETVVGRGFVNTSEYKSVAVRYMGISRFLANTGSRNSSVCVAVVDSGYDVSCRYVDYERICLEQGNCLEGQTMRDLTGHGTFVLNQIYEATDSSVQIIPVKVADDTSGSYPVSMMITGVIQAVEAGADFINLSSGTDVGYFEQFVAGEDVLQYALDNGCCIVAAAGNDSRNANMTWPAKSSRCLTVTAISHVTGRHASYANYGFAVDFAAPGGDEDGLIYGYTKDNQFAGTCGTSMAAPYYTAILANLKANGRTFSSLTDIRRTLAGYCEANLTASESSYYVGNGCVNLENAIDRTISNDCVGQLGSYTYTGSAIKPSVPVSFEGSPLLEGRDYEVIYSSNLYPGKAQITVTGRGVYKGTVTRNFTIKSRSLTGASVTTKYTHYDYTGKDRHPAVTVTLGGKVLTKDVDYSVSYTGNKNPGTATITVTGMGGYTGTAVCKFQIGKRVTRVTSGYAYVLVPKAATGRAVALKNGGMANNNAVWVNTRTGAEAQQFIFRSNGDGTFAIISAKCSMALDSYNGNTSAGASAVIRNTSASLASGKWSLTPNSDGTFLIVNKNSGKVLAAESGAANHADVRMHTKSGSTLQRFYLEQVSSGAVTRPYEGTFMIESFAGTGYVMDVPSASKASGTVLQIYAANGSSAQKFRILCSGDGTYRIENQNSGKVLMPTKSEAVPGAAVVQGTWSGAACQRWRIVEKNGGAIALKNYAGCYLEMGGNTAKNGVKLRLNEYVSAKRMMWVRRKAVAS